MCSIKFYLLSSGVVVAQTPLLTACSRLSKKSVGFNVARDLSPVRRLLDRGYVAKKLAPLA